MHVARSDNASVEIDFTHILLNLYIERNSFAQDGRGLFE